MANSSCSVNRNSSQGWAWAWAWAWVWAWAWAIEDEFNGSSTLLPSSHSENSHHLKYLQRVV